MSIVENNNKTDHTLQGNEITEATSSLFVWTPITIVQAIVLFFLAGFAEIVGGWLIWKAVRGGGNNNQHSSNITATENTNININNNVDTRRPWWYAILGSLVLILYGFIPCGQPTDSFGRIYAVYGGFFIVLSFLLGWALDGDRPDMGDAIGGSIALVGVCIILFWKR
jgi:small multidrug resistance family-3 protein